MVLSVNVASTAHLAQTDSLHVQRGHLTITLVKCTTRAAWDVLLDNTVIRRHRVFLQVHCVPYLFFFFFFFRRLWNCRLGYCMRNYYNKASLCVNLRDHMKVVHVTTRG